jgi:hypothetical protein
LINIHPTNNNNDKHLGRFSVCDFNHKKSKHSMYLNDQQKVQMKAKYSRRHSERLSFNHHKPSFAFQDFSRGQHSDYMTYRAEKSQPKSVFTYNPMGNSSSTTTTTTTTSNLTRSTINTTGSESSILVDQNKLLKPIKMNVEKSKRSFRK